jgi:predicted component of type VI protein secretion system
VSYGVSTMTTTVGDELLARIREAVRQQGVPVSQQEAVIELVGRSLITILNDPAFFMQLRPVLELQAENGMLRNMLASVQAQMNRLVVAKSPRKRTAAPRKRAATPKVVKKAPTVRVKGSTAANRTAFRKGFSGT